MDAQAALLRRLLALEESQAKLQREVSQLRTATESPDGGAQRSEYPSSSRRPRQPPLPLPPSSRTPRAELAKKREASGNNKQLLRLERRVGAPWQPSSSWRRRLPPPAVDRARLSRRHHMMVMQSLGQALHIIDLQGKVIYWNRCAEHLYGYPAAEALGRNVMELLVHPDDVASAMSIVGSIFTGKCWRGKFPVKKKSGERFSILTNGTPLYDDDGSMMGLICLSEDTRILQKIMWLSTSEYYHPNM